MSDNKKIKDEEESKTSGGWGQPDIGGTCKNCHKYFRQVYVITESSGCGSNSYWICLNCGHKN